ncbi:hypothetical protein [Candidatus Methylacidithermus pantelleriae]|uniref:Uncharacterized protein n=1 Tax=Candidatus Methylacidithermus pantelleriae TaxID=2744239 RepID=A0A8J2BNL3_9BACT|nr:hypothetical protein [Candidatus Methylacidithermus pantelleriae]CAF0693967.1 conserved membrane hypothetical protein [Candidatus Methylacidithermus pantelleriae]
MIYAFSLRSVSLFLGALHFLFGLSLYLFPQNVGRTLGLLLRNALAGRLMSLSATIWATLLCASIDLGELSQARWIITLGCIMLGLSVTWLLVELLFVRALGVILLLAAEIPLEAAFWEETPWRIVISLLAYAWIASGISMVVTPYHWRAIADRLDSNPSFLGKGIGAVFLFLGALLIILSFTVYPA